MVDNKRNLQYFEGSSMRELYETMQAWQAETRQRLLSLNVERDGEGFCCIALTNPTEVIIVDGYFAEGVEVTDKRLKVSTS